MLEWMNEATWGGNRQERIFLAEAQSEQGQQLSLWPKTA